MNLSGTNIDKLEKSLNYRFKNPNLITEALTHPSLKQHNRLVHDYERLELLGDSILGFLVTEMIYHNLRNYPEGEIAKIKSHLVSKETIVKVARKLNLAEYIIMTQGEEKSGGRVNINNIENTTEAILGAIYLDSDIEQVRKIVQKFWAEYIDNIDFNEIDPKSALQEESQDQGYPIPKYEVIKKEGLLHSPVFTVQVAIDKYTEIGSGKSIKEAEKNAAKLLLAKIKNFSSKSKL